MIPTQDDRGEAPRDRGRENAQKAMSRDMQKRLEESKKRWEDAQTARKRSQERAQAEREAKELVIQEQSLDTTKRRIKDKEAAKAELEAKIAELEKGGAPADAEKASLAELSQSIQGLASEALREEQIVRRLKLKSRPSNYGEI